MGNRLSKLSLLFVGMLMAGLVLLVIGVGLVSVPAAFIVGGLALVALAVSEAF